MDQLVSTMVLPSPDVFMAVFLERWNAEFSRVLSPNAPVVEYKVADVEESQQLLERAFNILFDSMMQVDGGVDGDSGYRQVTGGVK